MSRTRLYAVAAGLGVTASVALALLFAVSRAGPGAVTVVAPEAPASSVDAEAANEVASASGGGYGEGIKVHGRWTIEVREPDGTLVSRHQFDNALGPGGGARIARYLARAASPGPTIIHIFNGVGSPGPCPSQAAGIACSIAEPGYPFSAPYISQNLTTEAPDFGPNAGKLVLSGSIIAPGTGTFDRVDTAMNQCSASQSPVSCIMTHGDWNQFTTTTLPTAVQVSAGQQVLVTVIISFQ